MIVKNDIKGIFVRNIYEPLHSAFYRKDNSLKPYKFYKRAQWNTLEENKKLQAQKLYNLLKYASENIPYYKKIVEEDKINFSEKNIFEDIKKFPILTKNIIGKEFKNLYKICPKSEWYYNTSGGSTGEPVKLIQDNLYQAESSAMTRLQYYWTGFNSGDTLIKLWGSEKDILKEKEHFKQKFVNWIKSICLLNSFLMDEQKMKTYVEFINKKKPKLIVAYAQSIYELAKFIKKNNLKVFSPKSIMTSAGTLYPAFRQTIEEVFKCPVFDRYGSREVGNLASECEKHEGLHVSIFTHYVEILDKNLRPCREGEIGEVYVTLLANFTMPLIRYKIGDMAIYTKRKCSCGRGLPLIKDVAGREMDVFKTRKGKLIQGEFFIHFIGVVFNKGTIDKFQVIQKNYDLIEMKVVVRDKKSFYSDQHKIEKLVKKVMGPKCKIKWTFVKDILPATSGKYRYTIREFVN